MSSRRQSRGGGHPQQHSAPLLSSNQTYSNLAALRDKLRSTKITERRAASKELLVKLQDSSTLRKLEHEAALSYDNAMARSAAISSDNLS